MTRSLDLSRFPGLAHLDRDPDGEIPPRLADLAVSFPLLFFMLACDCGGFGRRMQAAKLAELGAPLADVAAAYGLPLSLRRIPPEACTTRLPWVRWSSAAGPQLANHVPDTAEKIAAWLPAVFYAARLGGEEFAIWVGRQRAVSAGVRLDCRMLTPLALFAWHSGQSDGPLQTITAPAPWSANLGLVRTIEDCDAWLSRLNMLLGAGHYPITDTWLAPGRVGDFDFAALVSWEDLVSERAVMRNCLPTYADRLANGACRLFAVRKGGVSVATLEINADRAGKMSIGQLKGPGNVPATPDVDEAARTWLAAQVRTASKARRPTTQALAASRLTDLLVPYGRIMSVDPAQASPSVPTMKDQLQSLRRHLLRVSRPSVDRNGPADTPLATAAAHPATARVHEALRARLGEEVFSAWFQTLEVEGCEAGVARVNVPVRFLRNWIATHYDEGLRVACGEVFGEVARVEVALRLPVFPQRAPVPQGAQPPPVVRRAERPPDALQVRIGDILALLSERYGVARADLLSQRRHRVVVRPRQIGMYLSYRLSGRSLPEIGRRFGGRDHTTVMHAIRKVAQLVEETEPFRQEVEDLQRRLENHVRLAA